VSAGGADGSALAVSPTGAGVGSLAPPDVSGGIPVLSPSVSLLSAADPLTDPSSGSFSSGERPAFSEDPLFVAESSPKSATALSESPPSTSKLASGLSLESEEWLVHPLILAIVKRARKTMSDFLNMTNDLEVVFTVQLQHTTTGVEKSFKS
jgi:hypothetical protein